LPSILSARRAHETRAVTGRPLLGVTLLVSGGLGLTILLAQGSAGYDWTLNYYPTTAAYLAGQTRLYDEGMNTEFYYPPWALLALLPFTVFGDALGLTLLRLASVGVLGFVAAALAPHGPLRPLTIALAVASVYTVDMLSLGQLVAWVALGVWLAWWGGERHKPWAVVAGLALMGLKPQITALTGIAVATQVLSWTRRSQIQVVAGLAAVLLLSAALSGLDWPVRWWAYVKTAGPPAEPVMSIYRMGIPLAVPTILAMGFLTWFVSRLARHGPTRSILLVAVAAGCALSPYVHDYDLPLVMALVWPALAVHATPFAAAAYLLHPLYYLGLPLAGGAPWLPPLVMGLLLSGTLWHHLSGENQERETHQGDQAEKPKHLPAGDKVEGHGVGPL